MSYELRALVSRYDATDGAVPAAGCHTVRLPQGYGLVPVTSDVFDRARRHLGVERLGAVDEFDALGLGRHRHTEDWFTGGG